MKKYYAVILAFCLISCVVTHTETKPSKETLAGTWEVTLIKFSGESGMFEVDLFDLVDSYCFEGSEWIFVPDNGTGKFTILNSDKCENKINRIVWSVHEPGDGSFQFQFKYVENKDLETNSNRGYRSEINELTSNSMKMMISTDLKGKLIELEMTFSKTSESTIL